MAPKSPLFADLTPFYPDPSLTKVIRSKVGGKLEEKKVFNLNHPDVVNMMRYVYVGCYLPTDEESYRHRMGIDDRVKDVVADQVNLMVASYGDIQADNKDFYDKAWTGLVDLAGKIWNYADSVGGDIDSAVYVAILKAVSDYHDKDKTKKDKEEARQTIIWYTKKMVDDIGDLQVASQSSRDKLHKFKAATTAHGVTLRDNDNAVKKVMEGKDGEIERLEKDIKDLQGQLSAEHDELSYDLKVATTTPAYAWCTIFGFIAAITVASIYGEKIRKLKKLMKETEGEIETEVKELEAARTVCTDSQRMAAGAEALIALVEPAITAIGELETAWQTMKDLLGGLHDVAKMNPDDIPNVRTEENELKRLVHKWTDFKVCVNEYRASAYISQPEILSLQEWAKKYCPEE
ncbi:hypothetical protein CNMCM8980_002380 [Aspergillus fumigatiaffinis]|nr:hypothetical protein CNMCM8980_002380 [Aspergillus fumigatiaffinis]